MKNKIKQLKESWKLVEVHSTKRTVGVFSGRQVGGRSEDMGDKWKL
jgi:hypothetical protein